MLSTSITPGAAELGIITQTQILRQLDRERVHWGWKGLSHNGVSFDRQTGTPGFMLVRRPIKTLLYKFDY